MRTIKCPKGEKLAHAWAMLGFTGTAEEARAYKRYQRHKARCKKCKVVVA